MGIDASIPLGVKPVQIESPMNMLAQAMQIRQASNANELGTLVMDEKRRSVDENQRYNALWQGALKPDGTVDRAALFSGAASQGLGSKIPGLQKEFAERDTAQVNADKEKFGLAKSRYEMFQKAMGALSQEPGLNKEMVVQAGQLLVQHGILPKEMYEQSLADMPDDPEQLRSKLRQGLKSQLTSEQIFTVFAPKPEKVDDGQKIGFRDTNPNSPTYGQNTAGGTVQKVATPGEVLHAQTSRENAAATRDVASATRDAAKIQTGFQNEQGLRKEFEGLPEVKNYKQAYPAFAAIKDAATRSTPQADINIVYGIAKLYDPNSVVREGEYATVANSPAIPERIKGYAQYLAGGGRLTPETKKQILAEAQSRIQSYQAEHDKARNSYDGIARRRGIDPANVFQATGDAPMGGQPSAPSGQSLLEQADAIIRGGK